MGEWPSVTNSHIISLNASTVNSYPTEVDGGTSNTKPSTWTEAISSTTFDIGELHITMCRPYTTFDGDFLVDVGIGAASSEETIISNLHLQASDGCKGASYIIPISIPSGTRIALRAQFNDATNRACYVNLCGIPKQFSGGGCGKVTTYGANTSDSGGVSIDPGVSAGTKGSWIEITSSTTYPINQLLISIGNQANTLRTLAHWLIDIAVGATEEAIIENLWIASTTSSSMVSPGTIGPLPIQIPLGSKISARAQCTITDATDRLFDIILYGLS